MVTLCIVDVQNDFCHPDGFFARHFGLDVTKFDPVVGQIEKVLVHWRNKRNEVIWTQALGDPEWLSATQLARYKTMGKIGFLQDGTWGADFYKISPRKDELVFRKGGYDPFTNQQFKELLLDRGEVILVGFFSDVCVNALAQTADSLGIQASLIKECSLPMFYPYEESLKYMQMYFGTQIVGIGEVLG